MLALELEVELVCALPSKSYCGLKKTKTQNKTKQNKIKTTEQKYPKKHHNKKAMRLPLPREASQKT